ncbi:hypothetical protein ACFOMD_02610 [Sphingoaurantiacus capsulatus]|uniref:Uncharacterized protein n=1 Tax=Sphingoaurantiacus capsulatus TaxID=1771310 RepID=A0ABV7X7Z5_9SPHN
MGKRTGVLEHEADVLKLTLAELDAEIARCEMRLRIARTAYLSKEFEKRIHWLQRIRFHHYE